MNRKTTRSAVLVAAVLALLAAGPALAADPPQVTKPVNITKPDVDPQRTYMTPFLLADPDNPKTVVAGFLEIRTKRCGLARSFDGGQTWRILDASPTLPSYPFCQAANSNIFQAPLAWGRNGTLYMAMVAWDTQDSRNKSSVQLARSTDLGDNWTPTLVRDARATQDPNQESNRPVTAVAVDTKSGKDDVVYVTYRRGIVNQPAGNSKPNQPMVAVSIDGGRTFGDPVSAVGDTFAADGPRTQAISATTTIPGTTTTTAPPNSMAATPNQAANFGGSNPGLAVDSKGAVYVAWKSATANISPSPPSGVFISKSTDKGKTWTVTQVQPFSYKNGSNFLEPFLAWSPEGGSQGTVHMVYEGSDRPELNSYGNIFYLRSTDGGATWSEPKLLPDDDSQRLNGKYIPFINVAPNGRVDVVWWDTRDDPGIRANDAYYTYSTDNGQTWAKNIRMTDQSIDRRLGVFGNNFDQNGPPGLASTNEYALVGWDDTRFSLNDEGRVQVADPAAGGLGFGAGVQDMMVAAAQFETLNVGGTSPAAKIILAAAIGLLAVGLVLTAVALASKRRAGGGTGAEAGTRSTRAGVT